MTTLKAIMLTRQEGFDAFFKGLKVFFSLMWGVGFQRCQLHLRSTVKKIDLFLFIYHKNIGIAVCYADETAKFSAKTAIATVRSGFKKSV